MGTDTVIGDPLLTVPINVDVSNVSLKTPLYLCYEIHGKNDTYFNFISDECVSVNAHYITPKNINFMNIIDTVSIVAIDNSGKCHKIQVNVNQCATTYDGKPVLKNSTSTFTHPGILIQLQKDNESNVSITVPNCADVSLEISIKCENVNVFDPFNDTYLGEVDMIKLTVNRGYNLREYSHGILGK